jgi:glycosyltransferase involved in cell wall biosynthesis
MRIGIVFHKNPFAAPTGIDLVRLRAISLGLINRGVEAEIIAPVETEGVIEDSIPVRKLDVLDKPNVYDLIKTSYHDSIMLIRGFQGPVVSRIVRVVDERLPERDEAVRQRLLLCQEMIKKRAAALVLNNKENRERWINLYGPQPPITLVPTGCPSEIPKPRSNPFRPGERAILFLGSLASPRMISMLNKAARMLSDLGRIHLVGLNKACMYGGGKDCALDPLIKDHSELPEDAVWDYISHASIGLAFATGPHAFDNDISKILNYLRGGLPVLSEEPIVNNDLIRQTGFGRIFRFDDINDMAAKARELIENPRQHDREAVMRFMAQEHSWRKRVEVYLKLFQTILYG